MAREGAEGATVRQAKLKLLQKHYTSFNRFMDDMMAVLGFEPTWMQHDIASYLQYGPKQLMVQAQRGEAKTTITAIFAVWCLIHDPKHRILIVSAGGKTASEIATLVQRLILTVPTLECLRPDPNNGDRTSVEAFDVHYSLKGVDKSPSVACIGIGGNLPGKRADLLIADDIESPKNSMTAGNRAILLQLSLEFSAICSFGRIVYLGTPQTSESIYNTLPGRGFDVRVWPGRYPTPKQRLNYGPYLAPAIVQRLEADPSLAFGGGVLGDQGKPTDPALFDEETLQKKQSDRGLSSFNLNYMLDTKLSDSERYPLKTEQLIVLGGLTTRFPLAVTRGIGPNALEQHTSSGFTFSVSTAHDVSQETAELQGKHFQIDPAGGGANGDETGYACTGFLNGNVYVLDVGGVPGGYSDNDLLKLAHIVLRNRPNTVNIEKNMGHGAFAKVFLPILRKVYEEARKTDPNVTTPPNITEEFVSGQKEVRIIGTLEGIIGSGKLIIRKELIEQDHESTEKYDVAKRQVYSLFHQIAKITKQRQALAHDDRIDALEGSVRSWLPQIVKDQKKAIEAIEKAKIQRFMADPFGRNRYKQPSSGGHSILNRFKR